LIRVLPILAFIPILVVGIPVLRATFCFAEDKPMSRDGENDIPNFFPILSCFFLEDDLIAIKDNDYHTAIKGVA